MLSDIPYQLIKDSGRKYDVWVLRDVYNNTFVDIAREYSISVATVVCDYDKIISLKIKYYTIHLSIIHGFEDTVHFRKMCLAAYDCYCDLKYVVAYFEKEYAEILSEYRNGEPGMSELILRDLPPFRNEFSKRTISSIIRLREANGMTYAAIGKRLHMTKEKAKDLYNHHYHVLYDKLSKKLRDIAGDIDLRSKYWEAFQVGSGKKKYDCFVKEYPELCESIIKAKNRK